MICLRTMRKIKYICDYCEKEVLEEKLNKSMIEQKPLRVLCLGEACEDCIALAERLLVEKLGKTSC